jgi:hypothetical protein
VGFHEVSWNSMRFHGIPWSSMRSYNVPVNRSVPTEANRGLTSNNCASCDVLFPQILYTARGAVICLSTLMDDVYFLQHPNYYIFILDRQVRSPACIFIQLLFKLTLRSHSCGGLKLVCQCWACGVVELSRKYF